MGDAFIARWDGTRAYGRMQAVKPVKFTRNRAVKSDPLSAHDWELIASAHQRRAEGWKSVAARLEKVIDMRLTAVEKDSTKAMGAIARLDDATDYRLAAVEKPYQVSLYGPVQTAFAKLVEDFFDLKRRVSEIETELHGSGYGDDRGIAGRT